MVQGDIGSLRGQALGFFDPLPLRFTWDLGSGIWDFEANKGHVALTLPTRPALRYGVASRAAAPEDRAARGYSPGLISVPCQKMQRHLPPCFSKQITSRVLRSNFSPM